MPIVCEHWVCVGDKDEAKKGGELWRYMPKAWTDYVEVPDPVEIQKRAEKEVSIEETLKSFFVSPDPDAHTKELQRMIDGGITTLLVHSAQEDQMAIADFFGDKVLRKVNRERNKVTVASGSPT